MGAIVGGFLGALLSACLIAGVLSQRAGARESVAVGIFASGALLVGLPVGAVVGAIAIATLGYGRPPLSAVVVPGLGVALAVLSLAFVRSFALAALVLFLVGIMQIVFQNACNTIVQVTVPDELRGRVMGVYMMVFAGATPVGASLIGSVAEGLGVPTACLVGGGLALIGALIQLARWQRAKHVYA